MSRYSNRHCAQSPDALLTARIQTGAGKILVFLHVLYGQRPNSARLVLTDQPGVLLTRKVPPRIRLPGVPKGNLHPCPHNQSLGRIGFPFGYRMESKPLRAFVIHGLEYTQMPCNRQSKTASCPHGEATGFTASEMKPYPPRHPDEVP